MESLIETHASLFQKRRQLHLNFSKQLRDRRIEESRRLFAVEEKPTYSGQQTTSLSIKCESNSSSNAQVRQVSLLLGNISVSSQDKPTHKPHKKQYSSNMSFAKKFQIAQWLVDIPKDFKSFLVSIRPSGKKTLLFIQNRQAISRDKNGYILHRFRTQYAGKSPHCTILEAVFDEQSKTYFIVDLIKWKGNYHTADEAVFRLAWMNSNLQQNVAQESHNKDCPYVFKLVEYFENSREVLQNLYTSVTQYQKDGLMFIHPESQYVHGCNYNVLYWKDQYTSKYPIDTYDGINIDYEEVRANAHLSKDGGVYTLDRYKLWQFGPEEEIIKNKELHTLKIGLRKIEVVEKQRAGGMEMSEEKDCEESIQENIIKDSEVFVKVEGFRVIGDGSSRKSLPDSLSKLVYQYRARNDPITISQLYEAL